MQAGAAADVVVVGSGAAGLAAALAAAESGRRVILLERSDLVGGTTAVSHGVAWMPRNDHQRDTGISDSREDSLTYLRSLALGTADDTLLQAFVDAASEVARSLEALTALSFHALAFPDYHAEFPGGRTASRSLEPGPLDPSGLGELSKVVRQSPHLPFPVTLAEQDVSPDFIEGRRARGVRTGGGALVGALLQACIARGVRLERGVRARRLMVRRGHARGVECESAEGKIAFTASRGVVLACGGFEWNPSLCREFLRGPLEAAASPPGNEGDGLLMAMEAGAALGSMSDAWWMPTLHVPGETYDGRDLHRLTVRERALPGSIVVNRAGRRFVNEAHSYNDIARAFHAFDPVAYNYPNLPAWLVFDDRYRAQYGFPFGKRDGPTGWPHSAGSIAELAAIEGIDPVGIEDTVRRFNAFALEGIDQDFSRGESAFDRVNGDPKRSGAHATLGVIDQPPFHAVRLQLGALGTKGGPRTNELAQVLNVWGEIIPGLYAAGNAMAAPTGIGYPGAGGTIGPALTFGFIAGRAASGKRRK